MPRKKQTDIKKTLKGYSESFQKDGKPISVNFRALVPELKKAERYTHLSEFFKLLCPKIVNI